MKKVSCLLLLTSCFLFHSSFAQETLLHQSVNADTTKQIFGPNYKNYLHSYLSYGLLFGGTEGSGTKVRYGNSSDIAVGLRYKFRVNNFFAMGTDLDYHVLVYSLKQDSTKTFPDNSINDKERLTFQHLRLAPYLRFNLEKKRGNRVGNFIDLGAYGEWGFGFTWFTKNKLPDGTIVKTNVTGMKVTNPFNGGAIARLGFNRWIFFASWRFSNLFKSSKDLPEMPRLAVGLQLGFY